TAHWVRQDGLRIFGPTRTQARLSEFPSLTLAEAKALWDLGAIPFVDARPREAYDQGHIPRAIYGHPEDEAASSSLFAILNPSQELVIYCAGGECKDSL